MGDRKLPTYDAGRTPSLLRIPEMFVFSSQAVMDLLHWVFPNIDTITTSTVLTAKNDDVDAINDIALD
jgi:hypothetical protein